MGIIKAYQDGNADRYREYLIDHATEFGIRPEKLNQWRLRYWCAAG